MAIYTVPEKYGGYSIRDIHNDLLKSGFGTGLGSLGTVASFLGVGETDKLSSGQQLSFNAPAQYTPNSSEYIGVQKAFGQPTTAVSQTAKQEPFVTEQRDRVQEYLDRLYGVGDQFAAVRQALGIPEAYAERAQIGSTIRDLPQAIETGAAGELTSSQIKGRTARDIAELVPGLEASTANLESLLSQYGVESDRIMAPYQIESGLLGEQIGQEYSLFKTNIQADLDRELANLSRQTQLDVADINRAVRMAEIESGKGNMVDLGDRVAYVIDGQEVASFNKGLAPSRSSGTDGDISKYLSGGSAYIDKNPGQSLIDIWDKNGGGYDPNDPQLNIPGVIYSPLK